MKLFSSRLNLVRLTMAIFCFLVSVGWGKLFDPPAPFDEADYENIGWTIVNHSVFGHSLSEAKWRAPYAIYDHLGFEDKTIEASGEVSPTAYRGPLLPAFIASTYYLFGREFFIWRLINCFALSVSIAVLCFYVRRFSGRVGIYLTLCLFALDAHVITYSTSFLTESLSVCLVILVLRVLPLQSTLASSGLALLLGALVLLRPSFLIWTIALLISRFIVVVGNQRFAYAVCDTIRVSFIFIVILVPWSIRNMFTTGEFMPFGTQAGIEMAIDYSDGIFENGGVWAANIDRVAHPSMRIRDMSIEAEVARSKYGVKKGLDWLFGNLDRLPRLILLKVYALWFGTSSLFQKVLLILSLAGAICVGKSNLRFVCLVMLTAGTLTSALSHVVEVGRLLVPLHPIMYLLSSLALTSGIETLRARFMKNA